MKTISSMKTAILALQATVAEFISGKVTAAGAVLTDFQSKLGTLEATITGELTQAQADLATAQASIKSLGTDKAGLEATNLSLTNDLSALLSGITGACTELKIETKAEATALEKITALKSGVSTTLAKAGFPVAQVPAAPASKGGEKSVLTLAEFAVMTPAAKMGFIKAGGKLTD